MFLSTKLAGLNYTLLLTWTAVNAGMAFLWSSSPQNNPWHLLLSYLPFFYEITQTKNQKDFKDIMDIGQTSTIIMLLIQAMQTSIPSAIRPAFHLIAAPVKTAMQTLRYHRAHTFVNQPDHPSSPRLNKSTLLWLFIFLSVSALCIWGIDHPDHASISIGLFCSLSCASYALTAKESKNLLSNSVFFLISWHLIQSTEENTELKLYCILTKADSLFFDHQSLLVSGKESNAIGTCPPPQKKVG